MFKKVDRAIAAYQAAVTPEAVKKALKTYKAKGTPPGVIGAFQIRAGALMKLQDVLAQDLGSR